MWASELCKIQYTLFLPLSHFIFVSDVQFAFVPAWVFFFSSSSLAMLEFFVFTRAKFFLLKCRTKHGDKKAKKYASILLFFFCGFPASLVSGSIVQFIFILFDNFYTPWLSFPRPNFNYIDIETEELVKILAIKNVIDSSLSFHCRCISYYFLPQLFLIPFWQRFRYRNTTAKIGTTVSHSWNVLPSCISEEGQA